MDDELALGALGHGRHSNDSPLDGSTAIVLYREDGEKEHPDEQGRPPMLALVLRPQDARIHHHVALLLSSKRHSG